MVSVLVPTFNRGALLGQAMRSVFEQSYRPLQLVVVDDGSTDDTKEIVAAFAVLADSDPSFGFEYYLQQNQGAQSARNHALEKVKGQYIQFLDSDDLLTPGKIERQVELIKDRTDVIAYGPWAYIDNEKKLIGRTRQTEPVHGDLLDKHLRGWFAPPHAYLWPLAVARENGLWDTELRADQDGEYLMRALVNGYDLLYCPDALSLYRMHDTAGQTSEMKSRDHYESRLKVCTKMATALMEQGLFEKHRRSLAQRSYQLERETCLVDAVFAKRCNAFSRERCGVSKPEITGSFLYKCSRAILGLYLSEWLASRKRSLLEGKSFNE